MVFLNMTVLFLANGCVVNGLMVFFLLLVVNSITVGILMFGV